MADARVAYATMPRVGRLRILLSCAVFFSSVLLWGLSPAARADPINASVGSAPSGAAMPSGFVGVSLEFSALHLYTGRNSSAINPVFLDLLRGIAPGQRPVIRIGGNSQDVTWWPMRGVVPPPGVKYPLTPDWMRTTRALAADLGARLIMGINLAAGRPGLAAAESRALLQGVGSGFIRVFEIGNEPDLYNLFPWYRDRSGHGVTARQPSYNLSSYIQDFTRVREAMPPYPLAGPSFAQLNWMAGLDQFLSAEPAVAIATMHRYPLRAGTRNHSSPLYPSIRNLLKDSASAGLAQQVAPYVSVAHNHGVQFRLDEMNSASNSGQRGLSNTFASALWVLDAMFNLASVGVDGVNLHSLPGARYELFTFGRRHGRWHSFVHPEYYGMLLFAQAFGEGAQMLPVNAPPGNVKVWATHGADGVTRVVLINKDISSPHTVSVQLSQVPAPANVEWLLAPSVRSTTGVTLGGRTFGADTTSGRLEAPEIRQISPSSSTLLTTTYTVYMPAASAVMLSR